MAVLVWALGLVVGLSLGRPVALPLWGWLAPSGGSLLLALVVRRWPGPALGLVALAGLGLGLARASLVADPPSDLPYGQTVTLQGQVADRPETRGVALRLRLADLTLETPAGVRRLDGAILLETTWLADWRRGDRLQVTGRLEPIRPGPDAPWETALARQGVHSRLRYPQVVPLLTDRAGPLAWLDAFHQRLITGLTGALPEPQAALAAGLVLGERSALPSALSEAMRLTGTSHLLALSGANLSLLLALALPLARAVAGRLWLLPTLGLLWLFVGLAGPEPSLLRAAVMGTVGLAGLALGRPPDPYTSLALAGALLAGLSPAVLGDPGFQLSFLATLALISLAPWLRDRLPSRLRDTGLAEQVTVQGLTAPVVLALHPQLSLLSLPVNLLLAPIVALALILGLLLALVGTLWPPAGAVLGLLAWLPLTAIIVIVETAADQPLAALPVGPVSPLVWWSLVGALGALVGLSPTSPVRPFLAELSQAGLALLARLPAGLRLGLIGGLVSSAVSLSVARWSPSAPEVTVLDVGQGDAILVRTPAGRTLVVDGGPAPLALAQALGRRLPLWERAVDIVLLSHPHADHLTGLLAVLERYPVRLVIEPGLPVATPEYQRFREIVARQGLRRLVARAGQVVVLDAATRLEILHPEAGEAGDPNSRSVVARLQTGPGSVLFTGDLPRSRQPGLAGRPVQSTVLKVPHQGAADALDPGFLAAVRPRVAVISVGRLNRYGHPALATLTLLDRYGVRVLRTDLDGTIVLRLREERVEVVTAR